MSQQQSWGRWALAVVAAGLLGWMSSPQPDASPPLVKPRGDSWQLAPLPRWSDQTSLAVTAMSAAYWGSQPNQAEAAAAAGPGPDARWRISAVAGVGTDRWVLVQFLAPGKTALRLRAGEMLPSGHRITRIEDSGICVQIGSRNYKLGVERIAP